MLYRRVVLPSILILLMYGFWISPEFKHISAGVAIFLFGMISLEEGFRIFSGGLLEKILKRSTDKLYKSIGFGFIVTSLIQSSSLMSVLAISFLGAGLIGLAQGIGIIFGANLGTTTGAWLIAGFGLKVKISEFAMPMLVFGVIFIFQKSKAFKGIGYILTGLGFLFLGIYYMQDGFETFKQSIDLSKYTFPGYKGLFIFVAVGILATVIMQSSHATIVLIITALASEQIAYLDALALVIGANIGTTITAILGSLSSNIDGKRLAAAHFIFKVVTGITVIAFIHYIIKFVEKTSLFMGIAQDDYTLKLALFHTVFNVIGVIIMTPLVKPLVKFLKWAMRGKVETNSDILKAKYLNDSVLEFPETALKATIDESKRLLDSSLEIISEGIGISKKELFSKESLQEIFSDDCCQNIPEIESLYRKNLKGLYGEIITFISKAEINTQADYINSFYNLKLSNRNIIEAVKMTQALQKNLCIYVKSDNKNIKEQYIKMVKRVAKLIRRVKEIETMQNKEDALNSLNRAKKILAKNDIVANGKLDKLIRQNLITNEMATALMNDSAYTNNIIKSLIVASGVILINSNVDINIYREEFIKE